jgi:NADH:ubiquinone oxidoreductase subunit E
MSVTMNIHDPENLWDKITETKIIKDQCDPEVKQILIKICSNHIPWTDIDNDFDSLIHMDKKTQHICFLAACAFNNDLEMIRKMISQFEIVVDQVNEHGNNCLTLACWKNGNINIIKYLINDVKMDVDHKNDDCDNCLTLACYGNTNMDVIDYLINDLKMDIGYKNSNGNNCLTLACHGNTNLEIIKYLINDLKMDINHTNIYGNNCLILACYWNTNLETIKYLINDLKMDIDCTNIYGDNCLIMACWGNKNLEIIKYLINDLKMDMDYMNKSGDNCLISACWGNKNLKIIKYLINDLKMDINHKNNRGLDCLRYACFKNPNLEIIKYLINDVKMDINHTDNNGDNCVTLACHDNLNLEIVKYLINDLKMDPNHTNKGGNNCLEMACFNNKNLEIIRYLINDLKMDPNRANNCLILACKNNTNLQIIQYLIESTNVKISFCSDQDQYDKWKQIIRLISKNFNRFKDALNQGVKAYMRKNKNDVMDFLKTINPFLSKDHTMIDPMDHKMIFSDYVRYLDELQSFIIPVSLPGPGHEPLSDNDEDLIPWIDFTETPRLLFEHNGSEYYGHRDLVYESVLCLKEIKEIANFDQPITLSGRIPIYLMNLWICTMYSKRFNLMKINPEDIILFLEHIDQYPTDFLTISSIECDLIRYLDTNSQNIGEPMIPHLNQISLRCRLKRLYLWVHNKQSITNQ